MDKKDKSRGKQWAKKSKSYAHPGTRMTLLEHESRLQSRSVFSHSPVLQISGCGVARHESGAQGALGWLSQGSWWKRSETQAPGSQHQPFGRANLMFRQQWVLLLERAEETLMPLEPPKADHKDESGDCWGGYTSSPGGWGAHGHELHP